MYTNQMTSCTATAARVLRRARKQQSRAHTQQNTRTGQFVRHSSQMHQQQNVTTAAPFCGHLYVYLLLLLLFVFFLSVIGGDVMRTARNAHSWALG